jgi:hypothetical protein
MPSTNLKLSNVTIDLTITELATFCDITPGVYNKLPRDVQVLVSEMRETQLSYNVENKFVAKAIQTFSA